MDNKIIELKKMLINWYRFHNIFDLWNSSLQNLKIEFLKINYKVKNLKNRVIPLLWEFKFFTYFN